MREKEQGVMAKANTDERKQEQLKKAEIFRGLHTPGKPLVLYNIWDAGSAQTVAKSGARAIATSSWAVAKAHGFNDGEKMPYDLAISSLKLFAEKVMPAMQMKRAV